jgi:hypothetical protein
MIDRLSENDPSAKKILDFFKLVVEINNLSNLNFELQDQIDKTKETISQEEAKNLKNLSVLLRRFYGEKMNFLLEVRNHIPSHFFDDLPLQIFNVKR